MFGEVWTKYSYLQITGLAGILYGTAIYNAPNKGSLLLEGQWWAFGIDCSKEYNTIKRDLEQSETESVDNALEEPLLVATGGNAEEVIV